MQSTETRQDLRQMFGVREDTPIPSVVNTPVREPFVSFAGTNPMDVQADMTPAPQYTESQMGFQRLLLREKRGERQPGEGWKSALLALEVGGAATIADLVEGNVVDFVFRKKMEDNTEKKVDAYLAANKKYQDEVKKEKGVEFNKLSDSTKKFGDEANTLRNVARKQQGFQGAFDFAEEWFSDSLYASVANAWVRLMTGVDGAKYVSETSAFIADWVNAVSQVFFGDQYFPKQYHTTNTMENGRTKHNVEKFFGFFNKSYRTMDFVNPVNVEAAFRALEEIPVVGDGVAWAHEKTYKLLETTILRWGNTLASKGLLGYHIGTNV